jgi:hypothetical protein
VRVQALVLEQALEREQVLARVQEPALEQALERVLAQLPMRRIAPRPGPARGAASTPHPGI